MGQMLIFILNQNPISMASKEGDVDSVSSNGETEVAEVTEKFEFKKNNNSFKDENKENKCNEQRKKEIVSLKGETETRSTIRSLQSYRRLSTQKSESGFESEIRIVSDMLNTVLRINTQLSFLTDEKASLVKEMWKEVKEGGSDKQLINALLEDQEKRNFVEFV